MTHPRRSRGRRVSRERARGPSTRPPTPRRSRSGGDEGRRRKDREDWGSQEEGWGHDRSGGEEGHSVRPKLKLYPKPPDPPPGAAAWASSRSTLNCAIVQYVLTPFLHNRIGET